MIRPNTTDADPTSLADLFVVGLAAAQPRSAPPPDAQASGLIDSGAPRETELVLGADADDYVAYQTGLRCPSTGVALGAAMQAALADGYEPVLWLGHGSTSEAWRCIDCSIGREIVVKVMRADSGVSPADAELLLHCEAEVLGKLNHPGIVRAVRRAGTGGNSYLALDFIDGDDLFSHCQLCGLGLKDRLRVFGRFVDAMVYLHAKSIVHGDLKPEHILVREDGYPVLIDFGLAASRPDAECLTPVRERVGGSGHYRAPEVVDGSACRRDPVQDVYAMGILLRGLLEGVDAGALHEPLQQIMHQATEPYPGKRWPDAEAFQSALRDVLKTRPLTSNNPIAGSPERPGSKPWLQSGMLAASIVALAMAAAGGAAWVIGARAHPVQDDRQRIHPREPLALSAHATLLEGIASHITLGQTHQAENALGALLAEKPGAGSAWEVRHLRAGIDGQADYLPFGESPFGGTFAITVAYDPDSQTLAYTRATENGNEVWVRSTGRDPRRVATIKHLVRAVAISPGGGQVVTLEGAGRIVLRNTQPNAPAAASHVLPRAPDARLIWFSHDGRAIYLFSINTRTVERWSAVDPHATGPEHVFDDCDHAYPLPSGDGSFLLATRGTEADGGHTRLRLIAPGGELLRQVEMPVDQLPTSADAAPSVDGLICLGMPDGFVRVYDSDENNWLSPCDLGLNENVPVVLYCPAQGRVFAGSSRVYVIDAKGQLLMRLGERDGIQQLITGLHYDSKTGSLTSFSPCRIHQWLAASPSR